MPLEKGQWVFPAKPSRLFNLGGWVANTGVAVFSQLWLRYVNTLNGCDTDILQTAVANRPKGTPLITVCNHESCLDEPALWGSLTWRTILNQPRIRMTPAASDILYTNKLNTWFFSLGKCVPVIRGDGVYQKGMDKCVEYLNQGGWVHIFPEGKVNLTKDDLRLKWGVGRLIAECKVDPIVIPFWHTGMDDILPNNPPYIPRIGKTVTMLVGKPFQFQDILKQLREENRTPIEIRKRITDIIQEEFPRLKARTEALHYAKINKGEHGISNTSEN
ncbi:tafazzin-like isoform X1 [Glandiceps talaboti]